MLTRKGEGVPLQGFVSSHEGQSFSLSSFLDTRYAIGHHDFCQGAGGIKGYIFTESPYGNLAADANADLGACLRKTVASSLVCTCCHQNEYAGDRGTLESASSSCCLGLEFVAPPVSIPSVMPGKLDPLRPSLRDRGRFPAAHKASRDFIDQDEPKDYQAILDEFESQKKHTVSIHNALLGEGAPEFIASLQNQIANWHRQVEVLRDGCTANSPPIYFDRPGVMNKLLANALIIPCLDLQPAATSDVTKFAFNNYPRNNILDLVGIHKVQLYCDGSHFEESSDMGWAVLVLADTHESRYLCGAFGGGVELSRYHPHYVGTTEATSETAEAVALIWALSWLLSVFRMLDWAAQPAADVQYDSLVVGGIAFADFQTMRERTLFALVNGLAYAARLALCVADFHVHSHSNHALNELVDHLAKIAARDRHAAHHVSQLLTALNPTPLREWAQDSPHSAYWAFFYVAPEPMLATFPPVDLAKGCFTSGFGERVVGLPAEVLAEAIDQFEVAEAPCRVRATPCKFALIQHNTCTLKQQKKVRHLLRQYIDMDALAIFQQESRVKEAGTKVTKKAIIVQSSADEHGNFGCRVMFLRHVPFLLAGPELDPVVITPKMLTVMVSEPRLLIVLCQTRGFKCAFISAHAPH